MTHKTPAPETLYQTAMACGRSAAALAEPRMIAAAGFEHDPFPICGFAWVTIAGNTTFGRSLKAMGYADKHLGQSGLCIWIGEHDQSYDRKFAHARAAAAYLRGYGIDATADGRLD